MRDMPEYVLLRCEDGHVGRFDLSWLLSQNEGCIVVLGETRVKPFVFKLGDFRRDFNPLVHYHEDAEVQLYPSSGTLPELVETLHICSAMDNDQMTSYVMSVKTAPYAIRIVTETPL